MRPIQAMGLLAGNLRKAWEARQPHGILCHRYKFIYFPVSKAAGSSVKTMIAGMEGIPITGNPHDAVPFDVVRLSELGNYPDYKRMAVVRNPWSRLMSCYKDKVYWRRLESGEIVRRQQIFAGFGRYNRLLGRELFHPDMSFDEFVRLVAKIPDSFSDRHFRSQYKSFCYPGRRSLVDSFIRMESFAEDMRAFLTSLGANDVDIKHEHKTRKSNALAQYNEELADITAQRYRHDIEILGYARPSRQPSANLVSE